MAGMRVARKTFASAVERSTYARLLASQEYTASSESRRTVEPEERKVMHLLSAVSVHEHIVGVILLVVTSPPRYSVGKSMLIARRKRSGESAGAVELKITTQ